jgi:ribonuclease HII
MTSPNFSFEKPLWKKGFKLIAGIDEVGRGSFAGPVVAGAVVFSPKIKIPQGIVINDSKLVSPKRRLIASNWIKENAVSWAVGVSTVSQINKMGIVKATQMAFRKAIKKVSPDYLLIDAFYIPYVKGLRRKNQMAIVKGDTKSISIAAASIVAKIHRDSLMAELGSGRRFKKYGWDKNKGYGTLIHRKSIEKYGITKHHRKVFVD